MRSALLFVAVVSLASGCQSYRDRRTIQAFLTHVGPHLRTQRSVLGEAAVEGHEITLLDGALTLTLRVLHNQDDEGSSSHLHALAIPRGREAGSLDLCLVGLDLSDAADALIQHALPPLVSAVRDEPLLGAQHVWSDTVHGIEGHSGYLGDYRIRGSADPLMTHFVDTAGVFANLPQLPHDGRMHLLKVVVLAKAGELRRTVELDGATKLENHKLVGGRSAASGAKGQADSPSMLVGFAVLDGRPDPQSDERSREEARRRLAVHPAWLPDPSQCPTKLLPASFGSRMWDPVAARGGRLLHASRGCEHGAADLCYAAAQEILAESRTDPASNSLFLRACQLGSASACTNAAAGRAEQDDCAFETYAASCERGNDPWGCVMLAGAMVKGDEKHRDLERARNVLPKACALGEDDPACQTARAMLDYLNASPSTGRMP